MQGASSNELKQKLQTGVLAKGTSYTSTTHLFVASAACCRTSAASCATNQFIFGSEPSQLEIHLMMLSAIWEGVVVPSVYARLYSAALQCLEGSSTKAEPFVPSHHSKASLLIASMNVAFM